MSRLLGRAATGAACVAIVLLVVLLVIIWTGVRSGSISSGRFQPHEVKAETATPHVHQLYKLESYQAVETTTEISVFDSPSHRFDLKTEDPWDAENATSKVGSQPSEDIEGHDIRQEKFAENIPPPVDNVAHISPKKTHQNIYEDPADSVTGTRHHTGHFRHTTAEVWDPHPQYEFKAFGKDFHLLLSQDRSFVSPDIKVIHVGENTTRLQDSGHQMGCFYSGIVKGDPKSSVSVSLCHGMTGHIRTSSGNYFIEPADRLNFGKSSANDRVLHVIYMASATRANSNSVNLPDEKSGSNSCVVMDTIEDETPALLSDDDNSGGEFYVGDQHSRERRSIPSKTSIDESMEDHYEDDLFRRNNLRQFVRHNERRQFLRRLNRPHNRYYPAQHRNYQIQRYRETEFSDSFETWRPRRALSQEYFVELFVVADAKMVEYHGDGLTHYILALMNTVSRIWKDPSIGNAISITVVKIMGMNDTFTGKSKSSTGVTANEMLKEFCLWQKHNNHPDPNSPEHHDAAVLLTRENLCHDPKGQQCDTLGLAELGRMCVPRAACAIIQDNGLAAAFTIAHEIGHVLSMPHDDDSKCRKFNGDTRVHNVMARMLDDKTFPWEWSSCSRHHLTEFLDSGYGDCLLNEPNEVADRPRHERLPGEDYSANKQCELIFGIGSGVCPFMVGDVCRRLWCTTPTSKRDRKCHTQHMPWADGTACAEGRWCRRGECVPRQNLRPVDGQWNPWKAYGECSRTCGGGVKKRYRECNNPRPRNGGKYCAGPRVQYRSCHTDDCPSGSQDFREEQCAKFNHNNMHIPNLPRDVTWHAKYTRIEPHERCKLYCQVESNQYYMLSDKVIDGTPCSLDDSFDICVNGLCKAAGCDHVLNSTAELDNCGVCRGDNSSCRRITGSYNDSRYGYNKVVKIPAGSSYIDIRQHGWQGSNNDSNYLALKHGERGDYILNGKNMISHHKIIIEPGITMEYSGPESVVERLNSSRPIAVDLILEILSVENLYPPQISYEYTVPKDTLTSYTWVLSNWSNCNYICQGTRYRRAECRSIVNEDVVSNDYCKTEEKPREESQSCNTHCNVRWTIVSKSECSSHCGPGTRTVTIKCVYYHSSITQQIAEHSCKHLERPPDRETCKGPCDVTHWLYGDWGSCSATCKGGVQTRTATCVDAHGQPVSETECNPENKVLKRDCGQETCPEWVLGSWSPCSVTCGVGIRQQTIWCQVENRIVSGMYCSNPPPNTVGKCEMEACSSWQTGDWSSCSVSCGEGVARRGVTCLDTNGAPSTNCNNTNMPSTTSRCVHQPCPSQQYGNHIDIDKAPTITFLPGYKWRTGSFGECSKSCGLGSKNRIVKCSTAETGQIVRDDYCDRNRKPAPMIPCNKRACYRWNTGDWSQCNSECGAGFKHRQVQCQTERGEILPDNECSGIEKPRHVETCNGGKCIAKKLPPRKTSSPAGQRPFRWRMSKWSPCSKSCGRGTQTRRVDCVANGSTGDVTPVVEQECQGLQRRPKSQRQCQRILCDFTWQEGTWSECSTECGNGEQRRTVTCHRVNKFGWIDPAPADGCRISEKPSTEQTCKLRECNDEYYWVPGPWKTCSARCGKKGRQTRNLLCHRRDGITVPKKYCPIKFRPPRKRKCNQRLCVPTSCIEAKRKYKTDVDNEYPLLIGGKNMSIYCHNMAGDNPLEYLTLPAGEHENFAEVYGKRLLDPKTCPFSGQRYNACKCVDDGGASSGHTLFKRLRLDTKTLHAIVDDFTFSRTQGKIKVEFGKAGDCYSTAQCPQGRFRINLEGTQLRLAPGLSWVSQGSMTSRSINKINQQKVIGKCGGYCGFCKLEMGLKLDVLPP